MKQVFSSVALIWLVLQLILLPFPFHWLPQVGVAFYKCIAPFTIYLASILEIDVSQSYLISDSFAGLVVSLLLLLVALLIVLMIQKRPINVLFKKWMSSLMIVLLCFYLLQYGLDKLFLYQFYTPAANVLHTEVGQLDKDLLFWTAMGTSKFYNLFMGLTECIAGCLLLFQRTRFLGFLASSGVFLHVFAINIGFDITVKQLSGLLLLTSLFGILIHKRQVGNLINLKWEGSEPIFHSVKMLFILLIPFVIELAVHYSSVERLTNGKTFIVENGSFNNQPLKRIHLHPKGRLIFENEQGVFTSFHLNREQQLIKIEIKWTPISFKKNKIEISGFGSFEVIEVDLSKLPLLQDKTHFFVEEMY